MKKLKILYRVLFLLTAVMVTGLLHVNPGRDSLCNRAKAEIKIADNHSEEKDPVNDNERFGNGPSDEIIEQEFVYYKRDHSTSGNVLCIADEMKFLTTEDKEELSAKMLPLTAYGDVIFVTTEREGGSVEYKAAQLLGNYTGGTVSGTIFMIDMNLRKLYIYNVGDFQNKITDTDCKNITDRVYRLATKGKYLACAENVFQFEMDTIGGKTVHSSMQIVTKFFLALIVALLFNFVIARISSRPKKTTLSEWKKNTHSKITFTKKTVLFIREERISRGNSHRGGHGGGGHGGGGHSGGGHGF